VVPKQIAQTYHTKETDEDIEVVQKINNLCKKLKGLTYLKGINKPKYELDDDAKQSYLNNRINAAQKLSIYDSVKIAFIKVSFTRAYYWIR
tara:strand:- start:33808 stop:34080 length:273 start_codon:yes stop_codon:yes gene_type:complete